jgi:hypothetical protein
MLKGCYLPKNSHYLCINHLLSFGDNYLFSYLSTSDIWDLLLTDWVTKVKPDMNSVEVHPQQSHIRHPVHVVVVGAGSLWPFIGTVPT